MYSAPAAQASFQQPYAHAYPPHPLPPPQYPAVTGYAQPPYQPVPSPAAYASQAYQQPYAPPPAAASQNGPPLKKLKGNPVITRYSMPHGHRQQQSYAAPSYAAPAYTTNPPPQPQSAYQGYQPPPTVAYPPSAAYSSQLVYDPNQTYQQPSYQPPHPAQAVPASAQSYAASSLVSTYPPQDQIGYYDTNGVYIAYSVPLAHPTAYLDANGYPAPVSEDGYAASHTRQSSLDFGLDFDLEAEAGVPAEEVVPELSLGLVTWHPAVPTSKPLPSIFEEADPAWTESVKVVEGSHISATSEFFPDDMSVDIRLSVRDTDEWQKVKDDLIFVEFAKTAATVPLLTVIANRDRPDPVRAQPEPVTKIDFIMPCSRVDSQVQQSSAGADEDQSDGDQAMDMSDDEDEPVKPVMRPVLQPLHQPLPRPVIQAAPPMKQVCILDSLEQALGPKSPRKNERQSSRASVRYSRSRSPEKRSRQGSQQPKAKPAPQPKDSAQENILAALGVEGSPKMVYPTPPPALGLPLPPGNRKRNTPPGGFGVAAQGFHYGPQFPPPPPPRESRSPSYDPWRAHDPTSPKSTTSQHTVAGSDFHSDDMIMADLDATPKAKVPVALEKQGSGRKRAFEEVATAEGRRRQDDDDTPRARRMRQSRQDVYGRYRR